MRKRYALYVNLTVVFETDSARDAWYTLYGLYRENNETSLSIFDRVADRILAYSSTGTLENFRTGSIMRTTWKHEQNRRAQHLRNIYRKMTGWDSWHGSAEVIKFILKAEA